MGLVRDAQRSFPIILGRSHYLSIDLLELDHDFMYGGVILDAVLNESACVLLVFGSLAILHAVGVHGIIWRFLVQVERIDKWLVVRQVVGPIATELGSWVVFANLDFNRRNIAGTFAIAKIAGVILVVIHALPRERLVGLAPLLSHAILGNAYAFKDEGVLFAAPYVALRNLLGTNVCVSPHRGILKFHDTLLALIV